MTSLPLVPAGCRPGNEIWGSSDSTRSSYQLQPHHTQASSQRCAAPQTKKVLEPQSENICSKNRLWLTKNKKTFSICLPQPLFPTSKKPQIFENSTKHELFLVSLHFCSLTSMFPEHTKFIFILCTMCKWILVCILNVSWISLLVA